MNKQDKRPVLDWSEGQYQAKNKKDWGEEDRSDSEVGI